MKVLKNANSIIENKYGKQYIIYEDTKYRPLMYLLNYIPDEDKTKVVLANLMTGEIILLDKEEYDAMYLGAIKTKNHFLYEYLIRKWFLVPTNFSEKTMLDLMRIEKVGQSPIFSAESMRRFTILTTTDCNARCSYCYEKGCKKLYMDTETAHDVAKYIISNVEENIKDKDSGSRQDVRITWFGGEPTFNKKAISTVIDDLKAANIDYSCSMVSNGYLLDRNFAKYMKEVGNFNSVQITLDGIESSYNEAKNYIYKNDENPFKTVCDNIIGLLNEGINVSIRLNVGLDNKDELKKVVDYCADVIKPAVDPKYVSRLSMYAHIMFENCGDNPIKYDDNTVKKAYEDTLEVDKYAKERACSHRLGSAIGRFGGASISPCMISDDKAVLINPDGSIAKCEHNIDECYTSIYSDYLDIDYKPLVTLKKLRALNPKCDACNLFATCLIASICSGGDICCDAYIHFAKEKLRFYLESYWIARNEVNDKDFLYRYNNKTSRISPMDISKLITLPIDGNRYYILKSANLYDTDYVAVIRADAKSYNDIEIYKYRFAENHTAEFYGLDSYEEYYVIYDDFNKIIEDSIINKIIQTNTEGSE